MNKEELEKISKLIKEYVNKYNCRLELEEIEISTVADIKPKYYYKLIAIKEERIER